MTTQRLAQSFCRMIFRFGTPLSLIFSFPSLATAKVNLDSLHQSMEMRPLESAFAELCRGLTLKTEECFTRSHMIGSAAEINQKELEDALNQEFFGRVKLEVADADPKPLTGKVDDLLKDIKVDPHLTDFYSSKKAQFKSQALKNSKSGMQWISGILWSSVDQSRLLVVVRPNPKFDSTEILVFFTGKIDNGN